MRRFLALLMVLALFAAVTACGGDDSGGDEADEASSSSPSADDDDDDDDDGTLSDGSVDLDFGGSDDEPAEELTFDDIIEEIQGFWVERAERIDLDYEPLPDDRTGAPSEETVVCDGLTLPEDFVVDNTYAQACSEGPSVLWDPVFLGEHLVERAGEAAPAVVFAHEWGHIVQYQTDVLDITGQQLFYPTVLTETQADCYAGAWVNEATENGYGPFQDPTSLESSLSTMIEVRDPPGGDPNTPGAHGSGFDRVRAFQDGYERGIEYCFEYIEDPPFIAELPFTEEEFENQGNLPFEEVTDLVVQDLDDYFEDNVDDFDGPSDPFDVIPEDELEDLHAEVGDGAVATVFGLLWAEEAQQAADEDVDGEGPLLQRACLVGAWLGDIIRDQRDGEVERESGVSLSPGDLDETLITFLRLTAEAMSEGGLTFEAIGDIRLGFFGGIEDCRLG